MKVEQDESERVDHDRDAVQHSRLLHHHLQSLLQVVHSSHSFRLNEHDYYSYPDGGFDGDVLSRGQIVIIFSPRLWPGLGRQKGRGGRDLPQRKNGQYDGVLDNGTEDTADTGHDESLNSIEITGA